MRTSRIGSRSDIVSVVHKSTFGGFMANRFFRGSGQALTGDRAKTESFSIESSESARPALVEVRELAKTFRIGVRGREEVCALRDISFSVEEGQFFTLVGPSGCGKSTLLRCIAGLEMAEQGEIRIDRQVVYSGVTGVHVSTDRRPIGMVFQSYAIWPHMSVIENAVFGLRFGRDKVDKHKSHELAEEMLERFGLASMSSRSPSELSGGQQQRLALARALLSNPRLLLLDEPLSNLDAERRSEMRVELRRVQREVGITTIYVTHDQSEALSMSDVLTVVMGGKIVESGTPRQLYFNPRTSIGARVTGRVNLIPIKRLYTDGGQVRCETELGTISVSSRPTDELPETGERMLSVRPENVHVFSNGEGEIFGPNVFEARIVGAEFVGNHMNLTVRLGDLDLAASVSGEDRFSLGDRVSVGLPSSAFSIVV